MTMVYALVAVACLVALPLTGVAALVFGVTMRGMMLTVIGTVVVESTAMLAGKAPNALTGVAMSRQVLDQHGSICQSQHSHTQHKALGHNVDLPLKRRTRDNHPQMAKVKANIG